MTDTTPLLTQCKPSIRTVTGWTILFMVLLRIAIGWHFFYEGLWKLMEPDWQATPYLLASAGPFRETFRVMVYDPDGRIRSTGEAVKKHLEQRYNQMAGHYKLRDEQKVDLKTYFEKADQIQNDPDFAAQKKDYLTLLEEIGVQEKISKGAAYDRERLVYMYMKKAKALAALLARADQPLAEMENAVLNKLDEKQLAKGPLGPEPGQTELIDWANMIGLTAVGAGLMLGLFTRLSALGGVGLLAMYYLAMPPWPGLPDNPISEGHYLIVNKNLIEMIALLMIAASGVGRWGGLDAFCARRRLRCAARQEASQRATV